METQRIEQGAYDTGYADAVSNGNTVADRSSIEHALAASARRKWWWFVHYFEGKLDAISARSSTG